MPIFKSRVDLIAGYDTKGTRIMEALLLEQYKDKENLKAFIGAFIGEMDELFLQIREVEVGRYLSIAVGAQLDIIGVILQQSRNIIVPDRLWFGFEGADLVAGMANENDPTKGGIFMSEEQAGYVTRPLDDETYRRILFLRAMCSTNKEFSVNFAYTAVEIILGRVPKYIEIRDEGDGKVTLYLDDAYTEASEAILISTLAKWFIPTGTVMGVNIAAIP